MRLAAGGAVQGRDPAAALEVMHSFIWLPDLKRLR